MAEVVGVQTIMSRALPTGVDGARVAQWKLRSGKTFQQWVAEAAQAITGFNAELMQQWGWLFSVTTEPMMEYPNGQAVSEATEITDLDEVDAVRGTTLGHMIDLRAYGVAIGGSKRWFRDAREAQFDAQLRAAINQLRWRWERSLLRRWFTNTEYAVGVGGYDVPFVRGTGGSVDYTPPAYGGEAFTSSHDHYIGLASASHDLGDALEALAETLQEHGHEPPYIALVSRADTSSYLALPNFIEPIGNTPIVVIDQGGMTSGIPRFFSRDVREFGVLGGYQSAYGYVELRSTNRVPTGYVGMVKSYGQADARNPLAVRVHPDVGFGATIVVETTSDVMYPLKQINIEFEYGVSVGMDRTNGAVAYVSAGGSWANPTIS